MMQKQNLSKILMLVSLLSAGSLSIILNTAHAQESQTFSVTLSGNNEVPPTKSSANGTADFQVNNEGTEISYLINITGLKQVDKAHIHSGPMGENGDVVVTLAEDESTKDNDNPQIQLKGKITDNDLQGGLKDKQISDLVGLMSNGSAYVNAHTPIYPDGAIRGQITSTSATSESSMSANATTPSTDPGSNATSTGDVEQGSTINQSTDSPHMDIDDSMK
jgi:CHRD domain